jgi:hypothetical protein
MIIIIHQKIKIIFIVRKETMEEIGREVTINFINNVMTRETLFLFDKNNKCLYNNQLRVII